MANPKATYDYGTGVLTIDRGQGRGLRISLTGEEFDSVIKQLAEVCTSDVMDYDLGFDDGYAEAKAEVPDRYHEGYDDGHRDGYAEAQQGVVSSEGDEDDE